MFSWEMGVLHGYSVTLFDENGRNPRRIGEGSSADAVPDIVALGKGSHLVGKTLLITTVVASLNGDKTPVAIRYKLGGGNQNQDFKINGSQQDPSAYSTTIHLVQ